ncbi:MAG TPA: glycosyltransferase, partial [Bacteroidia bacterium]|nr:glycosyltransferase [Bacteroidia bacterium]
MKLLLLADINSAHTIKWASALASRGHEVGIFSCSLPGYPWYRKVKGVQAFLEAEGAKPVDVVQTFRPDILHAHYATRYGWIGRRTGFHPFVISAWGSDILEFPRKSVLHRFLLRYILGSADQLLATSHLLADAMKAYTTKVTEVLPFGIDTAFFTPVEHSRKRVVIGTIKSLEEIYGIDTLLKAYALLRQSHPDLDLSLRITGKGSLEAVYKQLSRDLGIEQEVVFTGWVNYEDIVTA